MATERVVANLAVKNKRQLFLLTVKPELILVTRSYSYYESCRLGNMPL